MITSDELKALVVPCWARVMKFDLKEVEVRVCWHVMACSLVIGRAETGPMGLRELALCCGTSKGGASKALKRLRAIGVVRETAEGALQFMPESDHAQGHHWASPRRLADLSAQMAADVAERAHRRRMGEILMPWVMDDDLAKAMGEFAVEEAIGQRSEIRGQRSDSGMGEGGGAIGGGGEKFLPARVAKFGTPYARLSLKSSPSTSSMTLFNTPDLIRKAVPNLATPQQVVVTEHQTTQVEKSAAGMVGEGYLDKEATDVTTLIKRLVNVLGKDGPNGMTKKGGMWTNIIRGSTNAADDPTTAEAVRFALNELDYSLATGKPVRNLGGFLWHQTMAYAAKHHWVQKYDENHRAYWEKGDVDWWANQNAAGKLRRKKVAVGAA